MGIKMGKKERRWNARDWDVGRSPWIMQASSSSEWIKCKTESITN